MPTLIFLLLLLIIIINIDSISLSIYLQYLVANGSIGGLRSAA